MLDEPTTGEELTASLDPQFPLDGWHPVPQYAAVLPHQPAAEQQLPNELPRQVFCVVPPQVASRLTVLVCVEAEALAVPEPLAELPASLDPQFPLDGWHPAPQ